MKKEVLWLSCFILKNQGILSHQMERLQGLINING
jgi:hypothetical protein